MFVHPWLDLASDRPRKATAFSLPRCGITLTAVSKRQFRYDALAVIPDSSCERSSIVGFEPPLASGLGKGPLAALEAALAAVSYAVAADAACAACKDTAQETLLSAVILLRRRRLLGRVLHRRLLGRIVATLRRRRSVGLLGVRRVALRRRRAAITLLRRRRAVLVELLGRHYYY